MALLKAIYMLIKLKCGTPKTTRKKCHYSLCRRHHDVVGLREKCYFGAFFPLSTSSLDDE